jgi:hypothetical protein
MTAVEVVRPRTREVIPTTVHPNFRDHGKTVDAPLLRNVGNLSRKNGEAIASEAGYRKMICEDTGHMPGVGTIPAALDRLAKQGLLQQVWLKPGGILPDGSVCTHGTRLVVLSVNRRERVTARAANRRATAVQRRYVAQDVQAALQRVAKPKALTPQPTDDEARQNREELLRRARELGAQWEREDALKKPPG